MYIKSKKMLSIFLTVIIIFSTASSVFAENKSNKLNNFTGEEIFSGLVFGQGKVAKLFPDLWTKDVLKRASLEENKIVANLLIDEMNNIDNTYFNTLKEAIQSENYVAVDRALTAGGDLLLKAFDSLNIKLVENEPITGTCVAVAVFLTAGVALTYGLAVHTGAINVQLVVSVVYWITVVVADSNKSNNGVTQLEKELFVGKLIDTLN